MAKMTGSGLLALGSVLTGAVIAVGTAFWIYTLESQGTKLWGPVTWISIPAAALGLALVVIGAYRKSDDGGAPILIGGPGGAGGSAEGSIGSVIHTGNGGGGGGVSYGPGSFAGGGEGGKPNGPTPF